MVCMWVPTHVGKKVSRKVRGYTSAYLMCRVVVGILVRRTLGSFIVDSIVFGTS